MLEFLQNLLVAVITAAVTVATTFLCRWLASLYERNKIKVKNEKAQMVFGQVTDMVIAAVETTTSTYVKNLKAENLFDAQAQQEAFNKTFETVKKQLSEESAKIIADTYGDVELYLTNKIEQLVEELKK
jgi:NADH:ubiquinone oxidoreductase subunit 6 (subunit J)